MLTGKELELTLERWACFLHSTSPVIITIMIVIATTHYACAMCKTRTHTISEHEAMRDPVTVTIYRWRHWDCREKSDLLHRAHQMAELELKSWVLASFQKLALLTVSVIFFFRPSLRIRAIPGVFDKCVNSQAPFLTHWIGISRGGIWAAIGLIKHPAYFCNQAVSGKMTAHLWFSNFSVHQNHRRAG